MSNKRKFVYASELDDGSKGSWICEVIPPKAGYELPKRFPGRKVISIKRTN